VLYEVERGLRSGPRWRGRDGDTLEECEAAMCEAIEFHIEGLRLAGESVPPATSHIAVVTVAD
jgi:predicted RNase H-like HicB family nuclease